MTFQRHSRNLYTDRLEDARRRVAAIGKSKAHGEFVEVVRHATPWRFKGNEGVERYLHGVAHHLQHFVPRLLACMDTDIHKVFDFGCGSGSASIAMAMVFPEITCCGTDINPKEVSIAHTRASLYEVSERCQFDCIGEGQPLPVPDNRFDLCMCCSVLEYVPELASRKFCVQEMARVIAPGGVLFMSVPNRLYPIEIHSRKFGWNWFPGLLKARIVGSDAWEVERMARPYILRLYRTPWFRLLTPWTDFCLKKELHRKISEPFS